MAPLQAGVVQSRFVQASFFRPMKRTLFNLLAVSSAALVAQGLSGCGGGDTGASDTGGTAGSSGKAAIAAVTRPVSAVRSPAVFYVDELNGKDSNDGQSAYSASAPSGAGPWQSLNKVSTTELVPGDEIRLVCGSVWRETLKPANSGTASQPIVFTSYPSACANPPVIDGSYAFPAGSWVSNNTDNIKRSSADVEQVNNGSLDTNDAGWSLWSEKKDATKQFTTSNCRSGGCVSVTTKDSDTILSSNLFPVDRGQHYRISYAIKAASGVKVQVMVRRAASPWTDTGHYREITGNDAWQQVSAEFDGTQSLTHGRFDVATQARNTTVMIDSVKVQAVYPVPSFLAAQNSAMTVAHHPNADLAGGYFPNMQDSGLADDKSSTYLTKKPELYLPADIVGAGVRIRTTAWLVDEAKVTALDGNRISFDTPTSYRLLAGFGFFFTGRQWMLDSPGEWFFDDTSRTLYAWLPPTLPANQPVYASRLATAVDLRNAGYVTLNGIKVRMVSTGVAMMGSQGIQVSNSRFEDIDHHGIDANASQQASVLSSSFERIGVDAISSEDNNGSPSTGMQVIGNKVSNAGVLVDGSGVAVSLPRRSFGAIRAGSNAVVRGNVVEYAGNIGIKILGGGMVENNYVHDACAVLDDCGGIYTNDFKNNTVIRNNVVEHSRGVPYGKPSFSTQAQGIYLDEHAEGVTVQGNTSFGSDNGIQVHVSGRNRLLDNKLFGNRERQLWLQETPNNRDESRVDGDLYDNVVTGNEMVADRAGALAFERYSSALRPVASPFDALADFATFDKNRYDDRFDMRIGLDVVYTSGTSKVSRYLTLTNFQQLASATPGVKQEVNGWSARRTPFAPLRIGDTAVTVNNPDVADSTAGWTYYLGGVKGVPGLAREACGSFYCATLTVPDLQIKGNVGTPAFKLAQGQWYRVSVDVVSNMPVQMGLMEDGSNKRLSDQTFTAPAGAALTRQSFVFQAKDSSIATRLYFEQLQPKQRVQVTHVDIVPVVQPQRAELLVNRGGTPLDKACPSANATECTKYVRFTDGQPVAWPMRLGGYASEIIYVQDPSWQDADRDGIADEQELSGCLNTAPDLAVNSKGCALGQ